MVRNVSKWSKKWSENCSQVSKLVEWLKNGKNCFIIGQEWCKECIQKGATQDPKMLQKQFKTDPKMGFSKKIRLIENKLGLFWEEKYVKKFYSF